MLKIFLAICFFLFSSFFGCTNTKTLEKTFYFVCSGKFYNLESALNLSDISLVRGGCGVVFHKKAYFVIVSIHKTNEIAKMVVENMPSDFFVYTLKFPKIKNQYLIDIFNVFCPFFEQDLYVEKFDCKNFLTQLKSKLLKSQNFKQDFAFLKANLYVEATKLEKILKSNDEEILLQNAKRIQANLLICFYNYAKSFV